MPPVNLNDFDYDLPEELIAQTPIPIRDASRLLVMRSGVLEHRLFSDLPEYLAPGDALALNETKVIPARLMGVKVESGAKVEALLLKPVGQDRWEALVKPGKKLPIGARVEFGGGLLTAYVAEKTDYAGRVLEFSYSGSFEEILDAVGTMPTPPYIKKTLVDQGRYQTVYASHAGSAAAPTAGLHFTRELLEQITGMGVEIIPVLLHVGLGTFRPVRAVDIREHHMHAEYYEISPRAASRINEIRSGKGRVVAVGTTTTRCLESAAGADGLLKPGAGWTDIFIYPGYRYKVVESLITNFHLPKSTLLMMVSALAGQGNLMAAYKEAVRQRYRFYSFGDAMLIL